MPGFDSFFLMNTEDVRRYAVEVLHRFAPDEPTACTEIGDGNINYVFRVVSEADGHSVIVKQADRLLRSSGRPLDMVRNKIEAAILRLEGEAYRPYGLMSVLSRISVFENTSFLRNIIIAVIN